MKDRPAADAEAILNRGISGYHEYTAEDLPRLAYVSRSLCDMLGCDAAELSGEGYLHRVHPGDRQTYRELLDKFGEGAKTVASGGESGEVSGEYRMLRTDGSELYVRETVGITKLSGGGIIGCAVLTDITGLKSENKNLRFLNETMPCGFMRYTCEKTPRITFINDRMKQLLRIPEKGEAEMDYLQLFSQNIYMMIPIEDRRRFSLYLDRVYKRGEPLSGEMTVQRCDGTRAHFFGWVTKCINAQGEEEFQSACMDVTEQHNLRKERETNLYIKALTDVYDKIFEYDLSAKTVKCLYGRNSPMFRWIENIPMQMEEATEKWIMAKVFEEDLGRVREFFGSFYKMKFAESETPPVITYRALSSSGVLKTYTGLFVTIDSSVSLYCCRSVSDHKSPGEPLKGEKPTGDNAALSGTDDNTVMNFTDGLAAFEISDGYITPLYSSENVCEFFGYSQSEWMSVMKKRTPLREFASRRVEGSDEINELLAKGEAEFTYRDVAGGGIRRVKAICSRKTPGGSRPKYVMLYRIDGSERRSETAEEKPEVRIRTFGYFDVFVNGRPIAFRNEKAKELFALIVDRRGGFVSSEEAIGFLWEDEPVNSVTLARCRKAALRLKNTLEEYGISDVMESVNGRRRLVTEKVHCDLYDYLSGREEFSSLFKGSYLTNYSWGETTLGSLTGH